jgi:LysM repeat protein
MRHKKHLPLTLSLVLIVLVITTAVQTNRHSVQAIQTEDNLPAWTVLVYMASDNNLEYFSFKDLDEMEIAGSTSEINIVVQFDRAEKYDKTNGDWHDTRRFFITNDGTEGQLNSQELGSIGETNTGDPATLTDFIVWGMQTYPAEHYALVIWDHGGSWLGIAVDDSADGDGLIMPELEKALKDAMDITAIKLDIIGFDACMMGGMEVYRTIAPYAHYAIASPELIPRQGWDYTGFLTALSESDKTPLDLGRYAVDSFHRFYSGTGTHDFFSMGVIDLSKLDAVDAALIDFSNVINSYNEEGVQTLVDARYHSLVFASHYIKHDIWSAVDLAYFMQQVMEVTDNADIINAAQKVIDSQALMVLYHRSSEMLAGSTGLSIYFPRSLKVYREDPGYDRYVVEMPSQMFFWQSFLEIFYNEFLDHAPEAVVMDWWLNADGLIQLQFDIQEQGLALAFFFVLYQADDGLPILVDYRLIPLDSDDGDSAGHIITWAQQVPFVTDDMEQAPVLVIRNPNNPTKGVVGGMYVPQDGSPAIPVHVIFDLESGLETEVWGSFTSRLGSQPFEIEPQNGDHFEPFWHSLAPDNELISRTSGISLVFDDTPLHLLWVQLEEGTYEIGVASESVGANTSQNHIEVEVDEEGTVTLPPMNVEVTPEPEPCNPRTDWEGRYTVQTGDALYNIADAHGITVFELQEANCITDVNLIVAGQVLIVPFVNSAPIAADDSITTDFNTPIDINILGNDYDPDPDGLLNTASIATYNGPSGGTITVDSNSGLVTYTPNSGYSGSDSFIYTVNDNLGATSNLAVVTISITSPTPVPIPTATPNPYCVTNNTDDIIQIAAPGSLRWCIENTPAGGIITFDPSVTGMIVLSAGELQINKNLSITGPGAATLAINADSVGRVINIISGTVNISGLTISSGMVTGSGGGIYNGGSLTINRCTIDYNNSDFGAGIYNAGAMTIVYSTISNNFSGQEGGGIHNSGTLTMINSTISGNAGAGGGGIFNGGAADISFVTIADNNSGIWSTSTLNIRNTILARNSGNCTVSVFTSSAGNWSDDASCAGFGSNALVGTELGGLANNGGGTLTHAITTVNPAYNGAADCLAVGGFTINTSQNGVGRPANTLCDAGSYEIP